MPYASLNRITLVGNLTQDPELHELPSGGQVCRLRVACNGRRRNADGGYEPRPNYFDVSVFGARGETVHRYLRKGSPVALDGRLEWRAWESAEGERRQAVTIVASEVQFLRGSGRDAGAAGSEGQQELEPDADEQDAARAAVEPQLA
jgi:single-strand DNA-binding protein